MLTGDNNATLPPVRLPKDLLDAAKRRAAERDETLSQVIRRALRLYVEAGDQQMDIEAFIKASKPSRKGPRS